MQYYLYISNQARGPFDEAEILRSLAEGEIDPDAPAQVAGGDGEWFPVARLTGDESVALAAPPAPEFSSRSAEPTEPEAAVSTGPAPGPLTPPMPFQVLRGVRAHTCYAGLRAFIDFFFFLAVLGAGVGAGVIVWQGQAYHPTQQALYYAVAGGGFVAVLFLAIALRQWLLLFVDMADLLVAQHTSHARS